MSINNTLRVLIASSSIIIRSGIAAALKRMHELNIQSVEISTPEMLEHYVTLHTPDMILIDPNFGGWFDLTGFRETYNNLTNVKFVAIIANVIDNSHLKDYHEKIAIYDSVKEIADKLNGLMQTEEEQTQERTRYERVSGD